MKMGTPHPIIIYTKTPPNKKGGNKDQDFLSAPWIHRVIDTLKKMYLKTVVYIKVQQQHISLKKGMLSYYLGVVTQCIKNTEYLVWLQSIIMMIRAQPQVCMFLNMFLGEKHLPQEAAGSRTLI